MEEQTHEKKHWFQAFLQEWSWVILTCLLLLILRLFVFSSIIVSGHSMDPTLQDRERIIALKHAKVKRGDIVTFPAPDSPKDSYIKRVIGVPGDTVEYKQDVLYINGKKQAEPYLDAFKRKLAADETLTWLPMSDGQVRADFSLLTIFDQKIVPKGKYFVLGDNRQNSKDSRYIGYIDAKNITGVAKFCISPLKKFGPIR